MSALQDTEVKLPDKHIVSHFTHSNNGISLKLTSAHIVKEFNQRFTIVQGFHA